MLSLAVFAQSAFGQSIDTAPPSASLDRIALELNNPVTGLKSFAWDFDDVSYQGSLPGAGDQSGVASLFTLSWPIKLSNGRNLLLRTTIPIRGDTPYWKPRFFLDWADFIVRQVPDLDPDLGGFGMSHDHLGDVGFDIGYGGVSEHGVISMIGLSAVAPTSDDTSAKRDQYLLGPEFALGKVTNWGLFGFRAKHLTDIAGEGGQELGKIDTNETTVKLFFAYSLGNGWQIESNPLILYDWEAVSDNEWLVPVGAGVSRTFRLWDIPVKMGVELQKYVVSPDRFGPDWLFRFSLTPVLSTRLLD